MPETPSFRELMNGLQAHDNNAAEKVVQAYAPRLILLAQKHLHGLVRRRVDAEDVIQSVFKSFFVRQAAGEWQLTSWGSLWSLLAVITLRKCRKHYLQAHAQRRTVQRETPADADSEGGVAVGLVAPDPTPEEALMLTELVEDILRALPERERRIMVLTLQGESVTAISKAIGCSTRKVYRVHERLRAYLEQRRDAAAED